MSFSTPIALCLFNRPGLLSRVFAEIRQLKPAELFVFCDGPRLDSPTDAVRINANRAVLDSIDWECDLRTHFSEQNLGCKQRISSGISWAFEHTERLIVLEDDCLPHPSFFTYCDTLLEQYRDESAVMAISGNNFQPRQRTPYSYYFSKFPHCWGWATWRRAWQRLDLELEDWPQRREQGWLERIVDVPDEIDCWTRLFDYQFAGQIDSWAFPWMYTCWKHSGLTVLPERNLVSNIGFGDGATHTVEASQLADLPTYDLGPLLHPPVLTRNTLADVHSFYKLFYEPPQYRKFRHRLRGLLQVQEQWQRWAYKRKSA